MSAPYGVLGRSPAAAGHPPCVLVWLVLRAHPSAVGHTIGALHERDRRVAADDAARRPADAGWGRAALLAAELALDRSPRARLRLGRRHRALPDRRRDRRLHGLSRDRVPAPEPARPAPGAEHHPG